MCRWAPADERRRKAGTVVGRRASGLTLFFEGRLHTSLQKAQRLEFSFEPGLSAPSLGSSE